MWKVLHDPRLFAVNDLPFVRILKWPCLLGDTLSADCSVRSALLGVCGLLGRPVLINRLRILLGNQCSRNCKIRISHEILNQYTVLIPKWLKRLPTMDDVVLTMRDQAEAFLKASMRLEQLRSEYLDMATEYNDLRPNTTEDGPIDIKASKGLFAPECEECCKHLEQLSSDDWYWDSIKKGVPIATLNDEKEKGERKRARITEQLERAEDETKKLKGKLDRLEQASGTRAIKGTLSVG